MFLWKYIIKKVKYWTEMHHDETVFCWLVCLYSTLAPAAGGVQLHSDTPDQQGCDIKCHWQPAPDILYEVTACKRCPCHRKATRWKMYESLTGCSTLSNTESKWRTFSEHECNLEDKYELRLHNSSLGVKQIHVFCWLRKHITVFVDGYCNVPETQTGRAITVVYTNGRFIPGLT